MKSSPNGKAKKTKINYWRVVCGTTLVVIGLIMIAISLFMPSSGSAWMILVGLLLILLGLMIAKSRAIIDVIMSLLPFGP